MRKFARAIPALIILLSFSFAVDAVAKKKVRRGTLFCQGDHLHYGSSNSFKSRRAAMRDAIENWAGFTVFEYGPEWGHWRYSINKQVKCGREARLWVCKIQSTPCRKARRGKNGKYN